MFDEEADVTNYLVAVFSDRIQAETAYSVLETKDLPMQQVAILGRGYQSADEYGLIDPNEQARKQVRLMASWLVPFGFFAGYTFSVISHLETFAWAGELGNHVIGGILGAGSGGMGSLLVGGGVGLIVGGGDALPYRNRLNAGKYLVVVKGTETLTRKASRILQGINPENLQGYTDPGED
ncbi:hypothetical protein DO97_08915 [Neosynechococcus sphagnicola sy1]|uniref:Uncharacterized protein n=1 Tax=Neosynechococcus sphagnicola sy1 TaxID=1497020 RepID=A0A098TIT8_9CYAN|nr:hypothetical protein DO97_08915 [Neosynechococcus sphagnicola sy1]